MAELEVRIEHAHEHDREKDGGISFSDRLWLNDKCIAITMRGWHITHAVIEETDPIVVKYWVTGDTGYTTDPRWVELHQTVKDFLAERATFADLRAAVA